MPRATPRPAGPERPARPRRSAVGALGVALALVAALAVSGCSPVIGERGSSGAARGPLTDVPPISSVTPAADPRAYTGAITINLPQPAIDPVQSDPRPQLPATITDTQGTRVTVKDTSRILPLDIYGTISHTVFELGLGDHVIGRDVSSSFPEVLDRPLVTTNGHELSAEAILDLDPTVVITDTSLGPFDVLLQLRDAGIPVVIVDSRRSLDNLTRLTLQIADALGVHDAGVRLAQRIEDQTRTTREAIAAVTPQSVTEQLRTVFLYARGQAGVYYLFGEGSGADGLISGAGGYDVAREIGWGGMKPVTDEALINAQPDVIVMMTKGLESLGGVDGLLERFPALATTPAGVHRRVIAIDDDQVLSFGPRTPSVLNALAVALYAPDAIDQEHDGGQRAGQRAGQGSRR